VPGWKANISNAEHRPEATSTTFLIIGDSCRFEKRKDGARKLRRSGAAAAGRLWSVRDLRKQIA